jgi:GNAT superfamily N-acetyltransferase
MSEGKSGPDVRFHPGTPERWADFERVFGPRGAWGGCWCMWPRLRARDWDRSRAAGRKEAMQALFASDARPGLLAYVDGEPAAWVALDRRDRLARFANSRRLAKLVDRPDGLWSVVCFVVRPEFKGRGLMSRLLAAAEEYARQNGARVLEAYPLSPSGRLKSYEGFQGITTVFERAGFQEVGRLGPRQAIMRKTLA